MRLQDQFVVEAPIEDVYRMILDIDEVVTCMPGAELLERRGQDAYEVGIKVRVGPMTLQYRGDVEIIERDEVAKRAVMKVEAREVRSQGTAQATMDLRLSAVDGSTQGDIDVDVSLSGRVASMGQGAIQDVTSKLVGRFAKNLVRKLAQDAGPAPEPADGSAASADGHTPSADGHTASVPNPEPEPESEPDGDLAAGELIRAVVAGRLRSGYGLVLLSLVAGLVGFLAGRRSAA
jgi:carbon monoxide dehydrogenase subunit G